MRSVVLLTAITATAYGGGWGGGGSYGYGSGFGRAIGQIKQTLSAVTDALEKRGISIPKIPMRTRCESYMIGVRYTYRRTGEKGERCRSCPWCLALYETAKTAEKQCAENPNLTRANGLGCNTVTEMAAGVTANQGPNAPQCTAGAPTDDGSDATDSMAAGMASAGGAMADAMGDMTREQRRTGDNAGGGGNGSQ